MILNSSLTLIALVEILVECLEEGDPGEAEIQSFPDCGAGPLKTDEALGRVTPPGSGR